MFFDVVLISTSYNISREMAATLVDETESLKKLFNPDSKVKITIQTLEFSYNFSFLKAASQLN